MTYYTRVWEVDPSAANRSTPVEDEFDRIAAAFSGLETDHQTDIDGLTTALTLKANIASPSFTGTPTAPTPAVSDDSATIATTAFVQDVLGASGALLPPQTGHADEFLKTDGTSASWAPVAALDWASLTGKPTTLAGFGITNGQHAIEWLRDGARVATAPHRIAFVNLDVSATADRLTVKAPVFPHYLLLEQGIL